MIESLGVLLALLMLPILVPIGIGARGRINDEQTEIVGFVRILLGLVRLQVEYTHDLAWRLSVGPVTLLRRGIGDTEDGETKEDPGDPEPDAKEEAADEAGLSFWDRVGQAGQFVDMALDPALRLLKRLSRTVWIRRLEVSGAVGAGSPDTTGKVCGVLFALQGRFGKRVQIDLRPDFANTGFRGEFRFELWFSVALLIVSVLAAAITVGGRLSLWYLKKKLTGFRWLRTQNA